MKELFPWDVTENFTNKDDHLLVDAREPYEYQMGHIKNSINVPRGILETASTFGCEDTVPELASTRDRKIVLACRSGKHSLWAGCTMKALGFQDVVSLKSGIRGWNDSEQPLNDNMVAIEVMDQFFEAEITPSQFGQGWVVKDWKA
ncbi:MAG: rhodanese-like domain-containing protein [Gammaproteobacteria bacterium]|nr:rhodanese-like domain-containing protein [Gammaproteobacteria bacterium]